MRYFFYGTLRDPDVLALVVGRRLPAAALRPARLAEGRLVRMPGGSYPGLVEGPGPVEGVIVDGLTPADAARLARYEGEAYRLVKATAMLADGTGLPVRLFRARAVFATGCEPWDFARWQATEKAACLTALAEPALKPSPAGRRRAARRRSPESPAR
jgi:hypothetical protein